MKPPRSDEPSAANMKTLGDIPLFGGKIKSGTAVIVTNEYGDFVDIKVPNGHVVHGLLKTRLIEENEEVF